MIDKILLCLMLGLGGCDFINVIPNTIPMCDTINKTPTDCYNPFLPRIEYLDVEKEETNISQAVCRRIDLHSLGVVQEYEYCFDWLKEDWEYFVANPDSIEQNPTFVIGKSGWIENDMYCYPINEMPCDMSCDIIEYQNGTNKTVNCGQICYPIQTYECINVSNAIVHRNIKS